MLMTGKQTFEIYSSRFCASLARCIFPSVAQAESGLPRAALSATRVAPPGISEATTDPLAYSILHLLGNRHMKTPVAAALLGSRISAFSTDSSRSSLPGVDIIGGKNPKSEVVAGSGSGPSDRRETVIAFRDMTYTLTQKGEFYICSVLCGNSMYYVLDIALTEAEMLKVRSDPTFLDDFAGKVQNAPDQYCSRAIKPS